MIPIVVDFTFIIYNYNLYVVKNNKLDEWLFLHTYKW
jgi:hypothetical protein